MPEAGGRRQEAAFVENLTRLMQARALLRNILGVFVRTYPERRYKS